MSDISQWKPVDADNNTTPPDGWPEGMPASAVNDAGRAIQGAVRRQAETGGWFDWGHAATYVDANTFQIAGDQSAVYQIGRRVRASQATAIEGTVVALTVSANTDVTVTWDDGDALANAALTVSVGPALSPIPGPLDSVTSSTDAAIVFDRPGLFAAPWNRLRFDLDNLIVGTGQPMMAQFSVDGGATWLDGASDYAVNTLGVDITGTVINTSILASQITLGTNVNGTNNFDGVVGHLELATYRDNTRTRFSASTTWLPLGGGTIGYTIWGNLTGSFSINAVRFVPSTGTIIGRVRVNGVV